jgi:uncharacterized integral membrane protein (TIGR00697 family)
MLNNQDFPKQAKPQYKWLLLLAMIYLTGWTTTYLMVYKMVELHNILETGAIFLFPLSYAIADIISEVYGYQIARQVVWFSLVTGFIFCTALELVTKLPTAGFWHNESSYEVVFGPILRAYFALTIASLIGNFANIYIISKFKIIMHGKHFWFRSLLSTGIGELFFTLIGGTIAYIGIEPWSKIIFLMLDGYLFKMLYAFIAVWPAVLLVYILKKTERADVYDYGINYNPFNIKVD